MARQQLPVEERRRRNRENQKKRREKIHSESELKEEYLKMERQRWKKRVEEGKIKNINDLNESEKRSQRKAWKRRQQVSRERKRKGSDHPQTPPHPHISRVQVEDDGPILMQNRKSPLAMLMEEMEREEGEQEPMEQEPLTKSGPDGTVTELSAGVVHCGLACGHL